MDFMKIDQAEEFARNDDGTIMEKVWQFGQLVRIEGAVIRIYATDQTIEVRNVDAHLLANRSVGQDVIFVLNQDGSLRWMHATAPIDRAPFVTIVKD